MTARELASMIDHTVLKTDAVTADVEKICREALEYGFCSVCVNPVFVSYCANVLKGSMVKVCTVIGFSLGACRSDVKIFETERAVFDGADEIDMVIPVYAVKAGDRAAVQREIEAIKKICGSNTLKVILETCLLSDDEIVCCCKDAERAGADFVKTSTGFSTGGAEERIVRLMRDSCGPDMKIKASGGIRDLDTAVKMIKAGADRLGTSRSSDIIKEMQQEGKK